MTFPASVPIASSLGDAAPQSTARVLEFQCLYTHDIRRKAKRWQDGFLRFHTFNNRVMVYDIPHNFIGDMHWNSTEELQDGDEMTLDKGVLVQVAERIGVTQTDLTPLFQRNEQSPNRKGPCATAQHSPSRQQSIPRGSSQLRHTSLQTLLGKHRGPQGRALLPSKSPYEDRNVVLDNGNNDRQLKKQKICQSVSSSKSASLQRIPESPNQSKSTVNDTDIFSEHLSSSPSVIEIPQVSSPPKFTPVTRKYSLPAREPIGGRELAGSVKVQTERNRNHDHQEPAIAKPSPVQIKTKIVAKKIVSNELNNLVRIQPATKVAKPQQLESHQPTVRSKSLRLSRKTGRSMLLCQQKSNNLCVNESTGAPKSLNGLSESVQQPVLQNERVTGENSSRAPLSHSSQISNTTELSSEVPRPYEQPKRSHTLEKPGAELDSSKNPRITALNRTPATNRQFRRVLSESNVPMPVLTEENQDENSNRTIIAPKAKEKSGSRISLQRSTSLIEAPKPNKQTHVTLPALPTNDTDIGPWSSEAFDLFDWRPPELRTKG